MNQPLKVIVKDKNGHERIWEPLHPQNERAVVIDVDENDREVFIFRTRNRVQKLRDERRDKSRRALGIPLIQEATDALFLDTDLCVVGGFSQ